MSTSTPDFWYRKLDGADIRLLELEFDFNVDGMINGQLHVFPWDEKPEYMALSYVWGDANDTVPIVLNGRPFPVTKNLHSALDTFVKNPHLIKSSFLWIDAICINQVDEQETNEQVPRMSDIYPSALRVVGWLGVPDEQLEGYIDSLPRGYNRRFDFEFLAKPLEQNIKLRNWLYPDGSKTNPKAIPWMPYFPDPCEMFPGLSIGPHECKSIPEGSFGPDEREINSPVTVYQSNDVRPIPPPRTAAEMLLGSLSLSSNTQSTLPHDRIYGILGLVRKFIQITGCENLPSELDPDYGRPFGSVCHKYAMYLFQETRDTSILETYDRSLTGVPSGTRLSLLPSLQLPLSTGG
ncbi:heterokaryon incompatibility protein-domain-containing protein [Whalleya microplaca]|nr:heterokaryon incompatibility protein-domain-containing protein [Whalleya microplaca]